MSRFKRWFAWLDNIGADHAPAITSTRKHVIDVAARWPYVKVPEAMFDFLDVLNDAAKTRHHPSDNWLKPDGRKMDNKTNYKSISGHITAAMLGEKVDKDSGKDPRLHAACRLLMAYTRDKLGIVHPEDLKVLTSEYPSSRLKERC